jgi:hypothetical protein
MVRARKSARSLAWPRRAGLAAIILAGCVAPALAADDPVLVRFVGDWIGRGTYRAGPSADPEQVYCKITNRLIEGGSVLEQKGRCAIPSQSGPVKGRIAAKGGGRYDGSLQSISTDGPATLAGTGANGTLTLAADFVGRLNHKPGKSTITLAAGATGYKLTASALGTDGKPRFVANEITFTHD